jgi:hypothetical protein
MEPPEVPLEEVNEHIQHHTARHGHGHGHGDEHGGGHGEGHGDGHGAQPGKPAPERWTMGVALSTALFAALAAIASLIAGGQANEAMAAQIRSSDRWSEYQAKSIKAHLLDNKIEVLAALGHPENARDKADQEKYRAEKGGLHDLAEHMEKDAEEHLLHHETMATAVTMFQVAIAMGAIAVLTRMRMFWIVSLTLGAVGVLSFTRGALSIVRAAEPPAHVHASEHGASAKPEGPGQAETAPAVEQPHAAPADHPAAASEPAARHPAAPSP